MISLLDPPDGATVGCQRKIAASIRDNGSITRAEALFVSGSTPPAVQATLVMSAVGGTRYETLDFGDATMTWLNNGRQDFIVRATNNDGRTSTLTGSLTFSLSAPTATLTPSSLGPEATPFMVGVQAGAAAGVANIRLLISPRMMDGSVSRAMEQTVGTASAASANFQVDPSKLANGQYLIYPVVTDQVGNVLEPSDSFSPDTYPHGLGTDANYLCVFDPGVSVPILSFIAGPAPPGLTAAKMRDHLNEALSQAMAHDPAAVLVGIRGFGPSPDGKVHLEDPTADGKWWRYEFFNFTANRDIQVTWYSAYYSMQNPEVVVTENSPFGFSFHPFANPPSALVDSDVAATAYTASMGCPALTGNMNDDIRYESDQPFSANDVIRFDVGTIGWKGTAIAPVTVLSACQ
jgi:hypothetical protein